MLTLIGKLFFFGFVPAFVGFAVWRVTRERKSRPRDGHLRENESLRYTVQRLQMEVREREQGKERLHEQWAEAVRHIEGREAQLKQLRKELETRPAALPAGRRQDFAGLEQRLAERDRELHSVRGALVSAEQAVRSTAQALERHEGAQHALATAHERIEELEALQTGSQSGVGQAELAEAQSNLDQRTAELAQLRADVTEGEGVHATHTEEYEVRLKERAHHIETLEARVLDLEEKIANRRQCLADSRQKVTELSRDIEEQRVEYSNAKPTDEELDRHREAVRSSEQRVAELEDALARLRAVAQERERRLTEVTNKHDAAQVQVVQLTRQLSKVCEGTYDPAQMHGVEQRCHEFEVRCDELKDQLVQVQDREVVLTQAVSDANRTILDLREVRGTDVEKLVRLQGQMDTWDGQRDDLEARILILAGQVEEEAEARKAAQVQLKRKDRVQLTMSEQRRRDDLKRIRGIGPVFERSLNELGIERFEQVADLGTAELEQLAETLSIWGDRILRERWVEQAAQLAKAV